MLYVLDAKLQEDLKKLHVQEWKRNWADGIQFHEERGHTFYHEEEAHPYKLHHQQPYAEHS